MTTEIALGLMAVAFAVLVGFLIPLLIRLQRTVAESESLLIQINAELPSILKEIRVTVEQMNSLVERARSGVEHAVGGLHMVGTVGDALQLVQHTLRDKCRTVLANLAGLLRGFRAARKVLTQRIHHEGGTSNGR